MNKIDNKKQKYNLASATSRLFCRFFDLIIVFFILIAIYFIIFNSKDRKITKLKLFLFLFFISLTFFIYFVIQPFIFNGYTLFSKIFKIKIYSINLKIISKNKFFKKQNYIFLKQLFIREIFTIIFFSFLTFILSILAFIVYELVLDYLTEIRKFSFNAKNNTNPISIIFTSLYSMAMLINIFIIFNIIVFSGKRSFNDHISNTVVIKTTPSFLDTSKTNLNLKNNLDKKINLNLPGEVNNIDEIS